ncbi:metalloregulator ArsR/SmtB family transcription factor [Microlunatus sp. Gsoil 973]|uniref:metalloregulator ArsR/SmtB family transcription factor n=1 Tax=Microlunatus sp. Gsoil 973 TaxID=2672569 RepID=UPI0012B5021D|nr:metalloregulator ArsR/SmtB family transcription factor [Microlunatus sp. Gsoil 973]QGN32233.1 metalloregulator ArsR/SmtB family transcription factor [Microlunatus sp. Gsoil 973]
MSADAQQILAVIAEANRFRIVELLSRQPMAVGEVAAALGALQPQTTKHIQALEAAGVVRVRKLGRRRIAQLDRHTVAELARHFDRWAASGVDDRALESYERAIAAESQGNGTAGRTLRFERLLPASPNEVWEAWTVPELAARWWAPRHFHVDTVEIAPRVGAPIRLILSEGPSGTYRSSGRVVAVESGRRLVFTLAPLDSGGRELFSAVHTVSIDGDHQTELELTIDVSEVRPEAAPSVAGLEIGWSQLLDSLREVVSRGR